MEQHHRSERLPIGQHQVGAVPILREAVGIERAVRVVAAGKAGFICLHAAGDVFAHRFHQFLLVIEISLPIRLRQLTL